MSPYSFEHAEQAVVEMILQKAAENRAFRKKLLTDAKKTIKDEFNIDLPPELSVKFIEKANDVDAMYVLPDLIDTDVEITDEELEAVAGGCCWSSCTYTCGYGTSISVG